MTQVFHNYMPMMSAQETKPMDKWLNIFILGLLVAGLMVVASSSIEFSDRAYGNPFSILIKHLVYIAIGSGAFLLVSRIRLEVFERLDWMLLLFGIVLLVAVLVPGIGREVNGSWRWIKFGPVSIQPSELMKWFLILYTSGYLVRRAEEVRNQWSGFVKPIAVLAIVIILLLLEPDFGAVVVNLAAVLGMMFLAGVRPTQFLVLIMSCAGAIALMAVAQPYRVQRLMAFMDPWSSENVFGSGYQLTQALIALGRGEWIGVGMGNSMLKLFYLPEAHTDFVFAIFGEEYGLLGTLLIIILFGALAARIFWIGLKAENVGMNFSAYACYGISIQLAVQAIINMGVNSGLLPTKGLTLPLMSYGGSSLVVTLVMLGFVQGVFRQLDTVRESPDE